MPHKTSALIGDFLDYMEIERNRSPRTRSNYAFYLRRFLEFAGDLAPGAITSDRIRAYRLHLNRLTDPKGELLKKNTQNYHLIALRSFLKYLAKRDIESLAPEKIELGKMPERQVAFLESDDLERLLNAPLAQNEARSTENAVQVTLRDKAILELLFSTGLRVSELCSLKRDDVNLKRDEFTVRGKGSKLRVVFLSEGARDWLAKYLEARSDVAPYLFVRHDRASNGDPGPLTPRSVQRLVDHYSRAAGITQNITPHTMRHSYATDLLRNGADIRSVQSMLGHSSITTTQIYTHVTNQQLREIHKAFHGVRKSSNS
jgi:site-specific recombinase XerD